MTRRAPPFPVIPAYLVHVISGGQMFLLVDCLFAKHTLWEVPVLLFSATYRVYEMYFWPFPPPPVRCTSSVLECRKSII